MLLFYIFVIKGISMNKTHVINIISKQTQISTTDVSKILNEYHNVIMNSVADNQEVIFAGFGTFTSQFRDARTGRHPQSGDKILIPATTIPKFKPAKAFKIAVENSHQKK